MKQKTGENKKQMEKQQNINKNLNSALNLEKKEEDSLLGVDSKHLLAANEVKRLFGSDTFTEDNEKFEIIQFF